MDFDLSTFLKQGLMPFFGGTGDLIGANLQSQLARLRHQQEMQQLKEMYKLRGEEQEKGHVQTMTELAERERLAKTEDTMDRNKMLLRASFNIWEAEKTAQIHMKSYKYTEGLRHEHSIMEERLRQLGQKDPEKMNEVLSNSVKNSMTSLGMLDEMDTETFNQIRKLESMASDTTLGDAERNATSRMLARLNGNLKRTAQYREVINKQITSFAENGVTDAGIVPKDRQAFLNKQIEVLEDKMSYHGLKLKDIPPQDLIPTLNKIAAESGAEIEFSEADLKFLLAKYWKNLKATFRR